MQAKERSEERRVTKTDFDARIRDISTRFSLIFSACGNPRRIWKKVRRVLKKAGENGKRSCRRYNLNNMISDNKTPIDQKLHKILELSIFNST